MADRVYLSCWLRGYTEHNMLAHFEKVLARFPYSKLAPGAILCVYALEYSEPPALERQLDGAPDPREVIGAARELEHADCAYELHTRWDLWQHDRTWSLGPSPAVLTCYGPLFSSDLGEQIRIDVGLDTLYLPPEGAKGLTAVQSNIRSLLHLAEDIGRAVPVDKKALWSESGENLAERLRHGLE